MTLVGQTLAVRPDYLSILAGRMTHVYKVAHSSYRQSNAPSINARMYKKTGTDIRLSALLISSYGRASSFSATVTLILATAFFSF